MTLTSVLHFAQEAVTLAVAFSLVIAVAMWRIITQNVRYHCCLKRGLAPHGHPCLGESGVTIARKLRDGEYTSVAVVGAFLAQARRVNHIINAAVVWREAEALAEAAEADARLAAARGAAGAGAASPLPPFLGVPCSVKEAIAVAGCRLTSGLASRRHAPPSTEDATVVARLRAAGLIPICTTNVSEACMWLESSNCVYGRSCSAYDPWRGVGGSSGGEGALLSAGGAPVGVGADVGGSIRIPAAFNGVFGHKPTGGLIPNTGQHPYTTYPFLTTGPLAISAGDLWPLVQAMAGPDGRDPACVVTPLVQVALPLPHSASSSASPAPPRLAPHGPLEGGPAGPPPAPGVDGVPRPPVTAWADVTVFTLLDPARHAPRFSSAVSPAIAAAVERAAAVLTAPASAGGLGARRGPPLALPELADAFDLWSATLTDADQPSFRAILEAGHAGGGEPLHLGREMIRWALGASQATIPALVLAFIEDIPSRLLPARHQALLRTARELRARLHAELAAVNGVLLLPVHPVPAPLHDEAWLAPHNCGYTGLFNVLESPVTAVPMGLDGVSGLPLAIQVVGARGYDQLTIACACALEAAAAAGAGWTPPPLAYADETGQEALLGDQRRLCSAPLGAPAAAASQ